MSFYLSSFLPAGLGRIGVAVIFGVDELMDMGRTCVNLIGNCLATVVVARWEGEFDDHRARVLALPPHSSCRFLLESVPELDKQLFALGTKIRAILAK